VSAFLCKGCRKVPVKAHRARPSKPCRMSADGRAWLDFCSRACAARTVGKVFLATDAGTRALVTSNRARFRRDQRERLRLAFEGIAATYGVPMETLITAGIAAERRGYTRGFACAWAQQRRRALA
jgi:hypothetical protein